MRGSFVTFCGGEGAGKSTMASRLHNFFIEHDISCIFTKEPGGTGIGIDIRKILLSPENQNLDPKAELFLYLADRAQHFREVIFPSIQSGNIVVSDRFIDSTFVYQGIARGLSKKFIEYAHDYIFEDFLPDLTIIFDIPPEVGLNRVGKDMSKGIRNEDESRFDLESLKFHESVRQGFLSLASKDNKKRFFVVDSSKRPDEIFEEIIRELSRRGIIKNI